MLKLTPNIEQRWRKYSRPVATSWRVDETCIKAKGRWAYLYRAVDKAGRTVDFYLSEHRDVKAAKRWFFLRTILYHEPPQKITLDGYQVSHRGVADLKDERRIPQKTEVRSCAYLNNIVEQDHRRVKSRTGPMLGFKRFATASIVISGIEFATKLRQGQFNIARLIKRAPGDIHEFWMAVLVA